MAPYSIFYPTISVSLFILLQTPLKYTIISKPCPYCRVIRLVSISVETSRWNEETTLLRTLLYIKTIYNTVHHLMFFFYFLLLLLLMLRWCNILLTLIDLNFSYFFLIFRLLHDRALGFGLTNVNLLPTPLKSVGCWSAYRWFAPIVFSTLYVYLHIVHFLF